ncbi:MAG: hypothetical protein AMJ79_12765 [Phycisphaerae bacterium SM23_30]|nr:MAG: hypothetical protein AMJ79_12765 [Phycisphaerae bacterium SM23_30]
MPEGWLEILKFVGPPAAVAIIFFWQYCRFANQVLTRVDRREQTLLDFVSNISATSATTTEVSRNLSEDVASNTEAIRRVGEKIDALMAKVGDVDVRGLS